MRAFYIISSCLLLLTAGLQADSIVHRAVEPARVSLDVNLKGETLTLLVALSAHAIPFLAGEATAQDVLDQLSDFSELVDPVGDAKCEPDDFRLHTDEHNNINGYQAMICRAPEKLEALHVNLYEALPGLQEIDVWLITDQWQNKQVIHSGDESIILHPELF